MEQESKTLGLENLRPPLWGLALALVVGIALIGPPVVIPQTSEFTYFLGAAAMALIYLAWRTRGSGAAFLLVLPMATLVGWDGLFSDWQRLVALGLHAGLSLLLFVLILWLWWRWIGRRLPIGRFVLVTVGFSAAGFLAAWLDSLWLETVTVHHGLAQLDLIGRNLLLGASCSLGLEIGELRRVDDGR